MSERSVGARKPPRLHERKPALDLVRAKSGLLAIRLKAQILAEERNHVVLEPVRNRAGMRARVDLEAVGDSVVIEDVM